MTALHHRAPAWIRSLQMWLPVRSHFVLWGNIRDLYLMPTASDEAALQPLLDVILETLQPDGFQALVVFDVVDGPRVYPPGDEPAQQLVDAIVGEPMNRVGAEQPGSLTRLRQVMESIVEHTPNSEGARVGLVVDYASRLLERPDQITDDQRAFFSFAQRISHTAEPRLGAAGRPTFNPVIWVAEHDGDLPHWLTAGNDMMGLLPIPDPGLVERLAVAEMLVDGIPGVSDRQETVTDLAGLTAGLGLTGVRDVVQVARGLGIQGNAIDDAVRAYKLGVIESPWKHPDLKSAIVNNNLHEVLFGQQAAITKALDVLKRTVTGLSGAHVSARSTRPKGILFLAGPTGVGKTELARQLSYLVFGEGREPVRFDMSEFSEEHGGARLIGAPPGYVGYDAGGELTNAVRRNPHSLFLFDEIEKAHPRILDKFLQVLDDGRLTDGRGNTVHFSESLLVFTSNLGMMRRETGPDGRSQQLVPNVTPDMDPEEVEHRILAAIDAAFEEEINRPELRNRFGDNMVVFHFITPRAAERILDKFLETTVKRVRDEQDIVLTFTDKARSQLVEFCTSDLRRGGRGIGNRWETALVNPLARALFEREAVGGAVEIRAISQNEGIFEVELA